MLLLRCAWHPSYFGYPCLYGVSSWRGAHVRFSDGMCHACARRWRAEAQGHADFPRPAALVPAWVPRVGLAVALLSALVLAARPLDHAIRMTTLKPPPVAHDDRTQVAPPTVAPPVASGDRVAISSADWPSASPASPSDVASPRRARVSAPRTASAPDAPARTSAPPAMARTTSARPFDRLTSAVRTVASRASELVTPLLCRPAPAAQPSPPPRCPSQLAAIAVPRGAPPTVEAP